MSNELKMILKIVMGVICGIVLTTLLLGSWYTVDQGERGVVLRNGAVHGTAADPGLNFKLPFIDSVKYISVQSHKADYVKVSSYSKDQQEASFVVTVNYHASPGQVVDIYSKYGSLEGAVDRVLSPLVAKDLKDVFGQYTAERSIQQRAKLGLEVQDAIIKSIGDRLVIESVQLENLDFSDAYDKSVESRMLAEVKVAEVKQNWEKEKVSADIVRTRAQADADSKLLVAEAEAKATRVKGIAYASALDAKGKALRDNPELISLIKSERWNGILPTSMVPGTTVPFINIK